MREEFPKWVYHRELPARIVQNLAQWAGLGSAWEETPAAFTAAPVAPEPPQEVTPPPVHVVEIPWASVTEEVLSGDSKAIQTAVDAVAKVSKRRGR